mmetsp:Transcript_22197/g.37785  ORF Transcript_22197/g.37785 Transcript_22197/m.37785 type:complete len:111 (-) Transcript_22197:649-981(-)
MTPSSTTDNFVTTDLSPRVAPRLTILFTIHASPIDIRVNRRAGVESSIHLVNFLNRIKLIIAPTSGSQLQQFAHSFMLDYLGSKYQRQSERRKRKQIFTMILNSRGLKRR